MKYDCCIMKYICKFLGVVSFIGFIFLIFIMELIGMRKYSDCIDNSCRFLNVNNI